MTNGSCIAVIGSVTRAMQAGELLAKAAIPAKVIRTEKASGTGRRSGCVYGVAVARAQLSNAQTVLARGGIAVKQWNTE